MSKEDQANFKGGPPTAEYMAGAAKRQAEAEKRKPASFNDWVNKRNAALGKQGPPPAAGATAGTNP